MERNYSRHSGGGRYQNNRKKQGPPPFFILLLALIIIIVVVVIVVLFVGRGGNDDKDSASAAPSSQTSSAAGSSSLDNSGLTALSSAPVSSLPTESPTPPPEQTPQGDPEKLDAMVKIGDTGYEYYNFVEERAKNYITTICDGEQKLAGATMYNVIIPTSIDIKLPESYIQEQGINSSDQKKAIEYMSASINAINPDVKTVPIFDALKQHNNEYIYFRTDHHWTQLGAYYAYEEFCKTKGITPVPLDQFEKKEYPGFLGSFYRDSPNSEMENNPDTVEAYVSSANTTMSYTTKEGETFQQPVIADGTGYDSQWLYLIFCAGDQPYEEITNSDITDGSTCVVVKESFGNAFIPFLVNHYQHIYVVDYRDYTGTISSLAAEKGAQDVIVLNNISMTRNEDLISDLQNTF